VTDFEILAQITKLDEPEHRVGLKKRGLWYRPKACGYTNLESEAGRYTLEEAKKHEYLRGEEPVTIHGFSPKPFLTSFDAIMAVIKKQPLLVKLDVMEHIECAKEMGVDAYLAALEAPQLCIALLKATGGIPT
jgi:hypothetical protein